MSLSDVTSFLSDNLPGDFSKFADKFLNYCICYDIITDY